jgi:hypothetical protein
MLTVSSPSKSTTGSPPDAISTLFCGRKRATTLMLFAPDMVTCGRLPHRTNRQRDLINIGQDGSKTTRSSEKDPTRATTAKRSSIRACKYLLRHGSVLWRRVDLAPKGVFTMWKSDSVRVHRAGLPGSNWLDVGRLAPRVVPDKGSERIGLHQPCRRCAGTSLGKRATG